MKICEYINEIAEILLENCLIITETNIFKQGKMLTYERVSIVSLNYVNNRISIKI